ncbi:arsenate reductase (glutaredoxin) [Castellaniella hirudinis]|uniref:arsenate reductase (glutaredoxin) n=1 Tax=Castellaniella hirudinis TaxID=1144617 RepID=UPI0039C45601
MTPIIYHNPQCGTSRKTLALLQAAGHAPEIIEYLHTPPSRARLVELLGLMDLPARALLRDKGELYESLNLADPSLTEDQLIDAMTAHPALMNRPIVVTDRGARLCRPAETVLELLG